MRSESLENKQTVLAAIAEFFGLWSRVFVHWGTVGGQRLGLVSIFGSVGTMMVLNTIFNVHVKVPFLGEFGARMQNNSLRYFAIAFMICALVQRRERKREFARGVKWHGQHGGVSYLEFLSGAIPREWIYRYVTPGIIFLIGYLLAGRFGSLALGICLMISAVGFAVTEALHFQALEDQQWSLQNHGIDADRMAGRGATVPPAASAFASSSGLSSGLDNRLARDIADRSGEAPAPEAGHAATPASAGAAGTWKSRLALGAVGLVVVLAFLWSEGQKPPVESRPAPAARRVSFFGRAKPAPADGPFAEVVGVWTGSGTWDGRSCRARVETQSGEDKTLKAFVALNCRARSVVRSRLKAARTGAAPKRCDQSITALMKSQAAALPQPNAKPDSKPPAPTPPSTAKPTDAKPQAAVVLQPEKPVTPNAQACAISLAALTPFGNNRTLFEFTDDSGSWQMMLRRGF